MADTDDKATIPRMRMGEMGATGLKVALKQIVEESKRELRWPNIISIYKNMAKDATIAAAINVTKMMIGRVEWRVTPPLNATPEQKKRAEFITQCMNDMEHTWADFIQDVTSSYVYGFSVHEKVYRKRLKAFGSKYNDGLIGWKKLPIRSQDTITGWVFSDDGRDLLAVEQDLSGLNYNGRYNNLVSLNGSNKIQIPRKKFMLFRVNPERDNPEGNSPLKSVHVAWRYRTTIEEQEAIGIVRNMVGTPVIKIPPVYMSKDASDDQRAIYDYYQNIVRNLERNEQSGLVLPQAFDPETKQPLFEFELLSVSSGRQYDTSQIITRWDNKILTALFADFLKLGQDRVGSFALAGAKTNLMAMAIEARLKEIANVLNHDLIPQTFALNGWGDVDLPKFEFTDLDEQDLNEFSQAVQRIFATNAIEMKADVYDKIREVVFKLPPLEENRKIKEEDLPGSVGMDSRSGDGMAAGTGNGTGKSAAKRDNGSANKA